MTIIVNWFRCWLLTWAINNQQLNYQSTNWELYCDLKWFINIPLLIIANEFNRRPRKITKRINSLANINGAIIHNIELVQLQNIIAEYKRRS